MANRSPKSFTFENAQGEEIEVTYPTINTICGKCDGNGKIENPAFSDGFTGSEWNEMDEEEQEAYLGGRYDVVCPECHGNNVVQMADLSVDWDTDRATSNQYKNEYQAFLQSEAAYRSERAREIRYNY